jgi:hypothetical protein
VASFFRRIAANKNHIKKRDMKKLTLLILVAMISCMGAFAQKPGVVISDKDGWHKIGETIVDFKTEKDEIVVMGADKFAFLKFKVTEMPIHLVSFEIFFENGDNQTVTIGSDIKVTGETRTVKIEGGERDIKKVSFIYKTVANVKDKKARVELWGMKTNPDKKSASK